MAHEVWVYTLASVVAVSLISFIGIFLLSFSKKFLQKMLLFLVSFAIGGLVGDAFLHLLPEAIEQGVGALQFGMYALAGFLVFFIIEKFLRLQHRHIFEEKHKKHGHPKPTQPYVMINLFGDAIHNFLDGIIIAGSYLISVPLGIATTFAVLIHESAQEIGDFAVLIKGGLSRMKALCFNFISALFAVLGGVVTLLFGLGFENFSVFLLPFTFAGFVYLAFATLIPELHYEETLKSLVVQVVGICVGISMMWGLLFI